MTHSIHAYPDNPKCWLDDRRNGAAEKKLSQFLANHINDPIYESQKDTFAEELRDLFWGAFGRSDNDRADRAWGATTIRNRLKEINSGYSLSNSKDVWTLIKEEKCCE